jgi:P27 family predicted phage terminase small subunit
MPAGRKVIPISIKQAKGTHQPCRDKETYTPAPGKPIPPSWLNTRAKGIFRHMSGRLDKVQRASETHTEVLAILASRMEEVERFDKILNESTDAGGNPQNGYVYATTNSFGDPILKEHPAVRCREKAIRHVHSLLAELGLTPASMQRVGTSKPGRVKNEFADF